MQSRYDQHHTLLSTVLEKEEDGWKMALSATELVVLMDGYMVMATHKPEAYAWTLRLLSAHWHHRICLSLPSLSFLSMSHAFATATISALIPTTHHPPAVPPAGGRSLFGWLAQGDHPNDHKR